MNDILKQGIRIALFVFGALTLQIFDDSIRQSFPDHPWLSAMLSVFLLVSALIFICHSYFHTKQPSETHTSGLSNASMLVEKYGRAPLSSIILEKGTSYFFSDSGDGVIGYVRVGFVAVVAGEPVCPSFRAPQLLDEFLTWCASVKLSPCFTHVSDGFLSCLSTDTYKILYYGPEALIHLPGFSLSGSRMAKVRNARNKLEKAGYSVQVCSSVQMASSEIESELRRISDAWISSKHQCEMTFTLGQLDFSFQTGKKYFIARNADGHAEAFISCLPYDHSHGYYIDLTRRIPGAPHGIMEYMTAEAAFALANQNVEELSLGIAPLSSEGFPEKNIHVCYPRLFSFVYKKCNLFYGFRPLYEYKKKYHPHQWSPRYIVFRKRVPSLVIYYCILRAKSPGGVRNLVLHKIFRSDFFRRKKSIQ